MPLDAICLRALTNELKGQLLGARIDKVQQPTRDQIVLLLRGNLRLLLNAGPNQPRVQLTEVLRENPAEPPMLCMLLRKHLVGGRITEIEQSGLERIVTFTVRSVSWASPVRRSWCLRRWAAAQTSCCSTRTTAFWIVCAVWSLRSPVRGRCCRGCTISFRRRLTSSRC